MQSSDEHEIMRETTMNETADTEALEAIRLRFIEEWEAGKHPTLESYLRRYPQYALEITDFVVPFVALEAAVARTPEPPAGSAMAMRARERVAAYLTAAPDDAPTLQALRKTRGWSPARLAQYLNLPTLMVNRLERGAVLPDWPRKLEERLGELFGYAADRMGALLRVPVTGGGLAAAHYSAHGSPEQTAKRPARSFAQTLDETKATPEQRRAWLDEA